MSRGSLVIALLAASLVRPFALAGVAWLMLWVFRFRHPASRHAVWAAVLLGMLLLPFLSVLTPHWRLPVLPANRLASRVALAPAPAEIDIPEPVASIAYVMPKPAFRWPSVQILVIWCYLAGVLSMVGYRVAGLVLLRRLMARSAHLHWRFMRESGDLLTPVTAGILRPVVILPGGWRSWDARTKRAVLVHEFAHLRRHDALISALAWWVRCLFWFHPLAWWVSRKVSDLADMACDLAALERVGDAAGYLRMLLGFATVVNRAGRRVALPGLAIASGSKMDRRIDAVFEFSGVSARRMARPALMLALVGIPAMCLAALVGLGQSVSHTSRPALVAAPVSSNHALSQPLVVQKSTPPPTVSPSAVAKAAVLEAPAAEPRFEVVSIKPCSAAEGGRGRPDPRWLILNCRTVLSLILDAYVTYVDGKDAEPLVRVPVSGGPDWMDSERFTIKAQAEDSPSWRVMNGPMLQGILEDRFKLKIHRETRQAPVYAMTVAPGGLKMRPFEEGSCIPVDFAVASAGPLPPNVDYCRNRAYLSPVLTYPPRYLAAAPLGPPPKPEKGPFVTVDVQGMSLGDFSKLYLHALGSPVIDKTGLSGRFDFHLEYSPYPYAPLAIRNTRSAPPIGVAMEEQLGLKLEPATGPVEYLVIDSVEVPSGN